MNFDRNSLLGFGLLAILFFGYFYYTNQEQAAYNKAKARQQFVQDSITKANRPLVDTVAIQNDLVKADSVRRTSAAGFFAQAAQGVEEVVR
ncbi:MAG TPA: membrane protein insertase YidC, partial [Chitinophagaceae bacterium]|nr:membrane protein insertase YidC [Chitinophagaceae bacterium]